MTDIAIGETPPELVPPVPPEAPAELDAATPEAGAPAVGEVESFDRRISIPESLGPVRRAILEGLIDTEGPMSVSQLHAVMPPGTPRSTAEASILREFRSGRIERVSAGHYVLAKPKPPEAKPSSPPPPPTPDEEATWFVALEAWLVDRASWDVEKLGPRPIVSSATSCSPPPTAISSPVLLSMTSGRSGRYLKFFRSIACSW